MERVEGGTLVYSYEALIALLATALKEKKREIYTEIGCYRKKGV